jgi:transposase
VYVLRTGIQWKAAPKERFGSSSALHRYFLEWRDAGFFSKLWRKGIAELDEMEGVSWEWQSADSSSVKAPLAQEAVGPNPTDRGKKLNKKTSQMRREWNPAINLRNRS